MSIEALNWAKGYRTGSATKKAILMVLADYADEAWSCFPSQATIAEQAEVSERTVRRVLADWEADGLISRRYRKAAQGKGRTSDRIVINQPDTLAGRSVTTNRTLTTDQPDTGDDQPDTDDRPTGQSLSGESLENHQKEPPTTARASFDEFWTAWKDKQGKGQAKRAFDSAAKKGLLPPIDDLISAVENYFASDKPQRGYVKNASTWLHDEDWKVDWEAQKDGVLPELDNDTETLDQQIREVLHAEQDPQWRRKLLVAQGSTAKAAMLEMWERDRAQGCEAGRHLSLRSSPTWLRDEGAPLV